jgi:hypothetical protein
MQKFNLLSDKTQGKILLFITVFSACGLLIIISEFTNIIHFII